MSTIRATMTRRLLGEASGPLMGIYLITHRASGKRYVGQSVNIRKRWSEHRQGDRPCRAFYNALRKHGPEAFVFEIVELCTREELNSREAFYIFSFDCLSPKGYNLQSGGGQGQEVTDEVRVRLSASLKASTSHAAHLARLRADPDWIARNAEAVRKVHSDARIQARRIEAVRRAWDDPTYRERHVAGTTRANKERADSTAYTLLNIKTGEMIRATRAQMRELCGMDHADACDLLKGRAKSRKGWRLEATG